MIVLLAIYGTRNLNVWDAKSCSLEAPEAIEHEPDFFDKFDIVVKLSKSSAAL